MDTYSGIVGDRPIVFLEYELFDPIISNIITLVNLYLLLDLEMELTVEILPKSS